MNGWILSWFTCTCHRKLLTSIINAIVKLYHHRAAYDLLQKVTWGLFLTHRGWTKIPSRWRLRKTRTSTFNRELHFEALEIVKDFCNVGRRNFTNHRSPGNIVNTSQEANPELRTSHKHWTKNYCELEISYCALIFPPFIFLGHYADQKNSSPKSSFKMLKNYK